MSIELILIALILISGLYMAWNIGANDVANAIGTSVGSGALSLKQAVILAAILEMAGAFFFGAHVSKTVEEGIVQTPLFIEDPIVLVYGMLACLIGAGAWLQIASYFGWPVSTTHTIIGALIGFGLAAKGMEAIYWENVVFIGASWVLSPLIGGILSFLIFTFISRKVFFVANPTLSARKHIPPLVFIFIAIFSFMLLYQGLEPLSIELSVWQAIGLSSLFGLCAAIFFYSYIGTLTPASVETTPVVQQSREMLQDLAAARESLAKAKAQATGELRYQVAHCIDEINDMSGSLNTNIGKEAIGSQYKLVERVFGKMQIVSACLMAFGHGANDVANAIGPLAAAMSVLLTGSIVLDDSVPLWALFLGGLGIVLGLATWGWRVIETIGRKLTELTPSRGFSAEFGAAATILIASRMGFPVSATHTLVGAVLGVGFARGIGALNLHAMRDILISWVVTIPIGALIAILIFKTILFVFG